MEQDEFYQMAVKPDFPDEMAFELRVENPDGKRTFSRDGIEGVVNQIHMFIMARIMGNWDKTGNPPTIMRIALALGVGTAEPGDNIQELGLPFFEGDDKGSFLQPDAKSRIPRKK